MRKLDLYELSTYARQLAFELDGIIHNRENGVPKFYHLTCPECGSNKCCGLSPIKNSSNYRLSCLKDSCNLNSISLSMAIEKYGSDDLKNDWQIALGWRPRPKTEWHGIKNRRPRGKSQKTDTTSFRESQQQRDTLQHLKLHRQFQKDRGEW